MRRTIERRVRAVMPEESTIDLDLHAKHIAEVVERARKVAASRKVPLFRRAR